MKHNIVLLLCAALLGGCASTPQMYQWESYQPQVYEYFKGDGKGPEAQISKLEEGLQKIQAKGKTPPPGYHAHLGLLYARLGKSEPLVQHFQAEKTLFPESTAYMDFLLKKYAK